MKKLAIYNYTSEISFLLAFRELIKDYEIHHVIMYDNWGYNGLDAGVVDGSATVGVKICGFDENSFSDADTVLFNYNINNSADLSDIIKKIKIAHNLHKEILVTKDLSSILMHDYPCISFSVIFRDLPKPIMGFDKIKLYDLEVPVIMVFGIGENVDKFSVQLSLKKYFEKNNYKTLLFSTESCGLLFDTYDVPDGILTGNCDIKSSIIELNHIIKNLEIIEQPDVVIVGVPGGVLPLSREQYGDFGLYAFAYANAIWTDISILCNYYRGSGNSLNCEYLKNIALYRLNCDEVYFGISNKMLRYNPNNSNNAEYLTIARSIVKESLTKEDSTNGIFVISDDISTQAIFDRIKNSLINNVEVVM